MMVNLQVPLTPGAYKLGIMPIPCESCPARFAAIKDRQLISLLVPRYPSDEIQPDKTVQRLSIKAMTTFHG